MGGRGGGGGRVGGVAKINNNSGQKVQGKFAVKIIVHHYKIKIIQESFWHEMRFWQERFLIIRYPIFYYFNNTKTYKTSQLISTQTLGKLGQNSLYTYACLPTCFSLHVYTHLSYTCLSIYLHVFSQTSFS